MLRTLSIVGLLALLGTGEAPAQEGATPVEGEVAEGAMLEGTVEAVDGGEVAGVRVRAACGVARDSAVVDAGGRFAIPIVCAAGPPEIEIVDPAGLYFPSLPRIRPRVAGGPPLFLLVPRVWRIDSGTHAGSAVLVDLEGATAPACRDCSSFYSAEDTVRTPPGIPIWMESSLPLRVAFSQETGYRISETDSAAFMRVTEALERDLGRPWFEPAHIEEIFDTPPGDRRGSIIVMIDPLLDTVGRGNWVAQRGEIVAGIIFLQSTRHIRAPASAGVVAHELMHALGFGHTCSWRSVLVTQGCMHLEERAPTADDVAHAQLLLRLRTLERRYGIHGSIAAAIAGIERHPPAPLPPPPALAPPPAGQ